MSNKDYRDAVKFRKSSEAARESFRVMDPNFKPVDRCEELAKLRKIIEGGK